jgi:sRNA-binding regulator protein Hfq
VFDKLIPYIASIWQTHGIKKSEGKSSLSPKKPINSILVQLKNKKVTVFFNDGSKPIKGEILAYSQYESLLMGPEGHLLIFKHSVRCIKPDKPILLKELFGSKAKAPPDR